MKKDVFLFFSDRWKLNHSKIYERDCDHDLKIIIITINEISLLKFFGILRKEKVEVYEKKFKIIYQGKKKAESVRTFMMSWQSLWSVNHLDERKKEAKDKLKEQEQDLLKKKKQPKKTRFPKENKIFKRKLHHPFMTLSKILPDFVPRGISKTKREKRKKKGKKERERSLWGLNA